MHASRKLRLASVFIAFAAAQALALDPPPTAKQLRQWMGDECVSAGKRAGIDYSRLLDRAIDRDSAGLVGLFRFTVSDWFVGAAAENHCGSLLGLLQRWGDQRFARVLRREQ